jgi:hypothetical protein
MDEKNDFNVWHISNLDQALRNYVDDGHHTVRGDITIEEFIKMNVLENIETI